MSMQVGIVNYGNCGNTRSLQRSLERVGATVSHITNPEEYFKHNKIILPGVGAFADVMSALELCGLREAIQASQPNQKLLGICIGMHIMSCLGYENGETKGLNLIGGEVRKMQSNLPIPHMGFCPIEILRPSRLFDQVREEEFYFMHSYEYIHYKGLDAISRYGDHEFLAALSKENYYGVQFHPEKSREAGLKVLKNFCEIE